MILGEGNSRPTEKELHPQSLSLTELFPTADGAPTEQQLQVLALSQKIGVPFPVEPNPKYANWWHSLHEVAHWAVKPDWYNEPTAGARTIPIHSGELQSDEVSIIEPVQYYHGGNDIIPNVGMYADPTPSENEVRAWSILTMHQEGLEHPFRQILRNRINPDAMREYGDDGWHKIATAKVWSPVTPTDPATITKMAEYRINPLIDEYRAQGNNFELPHTEVDSPESLWENFNAIDTQHSERALPPLVVPEAASLGRKYWDVYSTWAFIDGKKDPGIYPELLEKFDAVVSQSIAVFERNWNAMTANA